MMSNIFRTYTTTRLLKTNNFRLQMCYLLQLAFIITLFAMYAMVYHQTHQQRCSVRGTTMLQTFGGFYSPEEDMALADRYPNIFKQFWSASEVIERSSNGFTVLSNIVITANQTRSTCPESPTAQKSICNGSQLGTTGASESLVDHFQCVNGSQSVSGIRTGRCMENSGEVLKFYGINHGDAGTHTCEIEGWCPLLPIFPRTAYSNLEQREESMLLEYSKNLIVLLKTAADFPECGAQYYGREDEREGKPECRFHPINDPTCPWFTIHDLVLYGGFISFSNVASTGHVFRILVKWDCNFDWSDQCLPKYQIAPIFGHHERQEWKSYYKEEPIYYGHSVRRLVRKFGLKFIIEHEGEGRKTTLFLVMKTFSLGFPYLFIPGFVITLLYNKLIKNLPAFQKLKYYRFRDDQDRIIYLTPSFLEEGLFEEPKLK